MNHVFAVRIVTLISTVVLGLFCFAGLRLGVAKAEDLRQNPAAGPAGSVIVQNRFGGQILGFDIDQASDEGVLSEYRDLNNGTVLAAVETFSQTTGQIIKVVTKTRRQDDFVTLGVVGSSVGLVEREHPVSLGHVVRSFLLEHSRVIIQDDSGIPLRAFLKGWKVDCFGRYVPHAEMFGKYHQPDLAAIYAKEPPPPELGFAFGYHWQPERGILMMATRK